METLNDYYSCLIDNQVSIRDLYIYHLLITDERFYTLSSEEIYTYISKISDLHDYNNVDIENAIEIIANDDYEGVEIWNSY